MSTTRPIIARLAEQPLAPRPAETLRRDAVFESDEFLDAGPGAQPAAQTQARELLKAFNAATCYNILHQRAELARHVRQTRERAPEASVATALDSFAPAPGAYFNATRSGDCNMLAVGLHALYREHGLPASLLTGKRTRGRDIPEARFYMHGAVAVATQAADGTRSWSLADPTFNTTQLYSTGAGSVVRSYRTHRKHKPKAQLLVRGRGMYDYRLQRPAEGLAQPWMAATVGMPEQMVLVYRRDASGACCATLSLDPQQQRAQLWRADPQSWTGKTNAWSFDQITAAQRRGEKWLTDDMVAAFAVADAPQPLTAAQIGEDLSAVIEEAPALRALSLAVLGAR